MQQKTSDGTYIPFFKGRTLGKNPVRPRPENVSLCWASGLEARRCVTTEEGARMEEFVYAGLFCDLDEDPELDAAMEAIKAQRIQIHHQEGWAEHWAMPRVALHLIAEGVQSKGAMRDNTERLGLAYGWRYNEQKKRDESFFRLQVMPQQLLGYYDKPLILSLNNTSTGDGYELLLRQLEVLDFARAYIDDGSELPLWTYALPVGAPPDRVTRGQGVKQKSIYPIIALPAPLGANYLRRYEVHSDEAIELLSRLSQRSVAWSSELTRSLIAGGGE